MGKWTRIRRVDQCRVYNTIIVFVGAYFLVVLKFKYLAIKALLRGIF